MVIRFTQNISSRKVITSLERQTCKPGYKVWETGCEKENFFQQGTESSGGYGWLWGSAFQREPIKCKLVLNKENHPLHFAHSMPVR